MVLEEAAPAPGQTFCWDASRKRHRASRSNCGHKFGDTSLIRVVRGSPCSLMRPPTDLWCSTCDTALDKGSLRNVKAATFFSRATGATPRRPSPRSPNGSSSPYETSKTGRPAP